MRCSMTPLQCRLFLAAALLALGSTPAHAYVGPGLGLGAIGAIVGAVVAIVLAFIGLLWYPIKRLLKKGVGESKSNDGPPSGRD